MALPKKGQLHQFMIPLVDSTDFGSVESGITESDFNSGATVKFYGVNHGTSAAFTSGTVSKTGRLVRSGVFQITLKGTENNYDEMMVRINKTGVAEQIVTWANTDYDDSDIYSFLSNADSNTLSYLAGISNTLSAVLVDTGTTLQSDLSILLANTSDYNSNLLSYMAGISDVLSQVLVDTGTTIPATISQADSVIDDIYSLLSDVNSNFGSRIPKEVASKSLLSDVNSDLASKIAGITATLSPSDISDIASAVWAADYSVMGVAASTFGSLMRHISSSVSDVDSQLTQTDSVIDDIYSLLSDVNSNFGSRIPKEVASKSLLSDVNSDLASKIAGITATVSTSDISNIASAVWAADYSVMGVAASTFGSLMRHISSSVSDVDSQLTQTDSVIDDIYSLLSDVNSNFASRIPKEVASKSLLSDVNSNMLSYLAGISDVMSQVLVDTGTTLPATLSQADSVVDDIYSLLSDLDSNFQSRVPKETAARSQLSDLASDVKSAVTATGLGAAGADITAVPGVTGTYGAKLDWMFALARNKVTQTSALAAAFNDAGSQIASATVSDDGTTFTRQEWAG